MCLVLKSNSFGGSGRFSINTVNCQFTIPLDSCLILQNPLSYPITLISSVRGRLKKIIQSLNHVAVRVL